MQRQSDRGPLAPASNSLAEQLDVVVLHAEHAFVELLLRRPYRRGKAPGDGSVETAARCHCEQPNGPGYSRVTSAARVRSSCMPSSASARDLSVYHERTRTRGVNPVVYWAVRAVLQPLMLIYFRVARIGREHVPREGGVLLAPNHRSFLDPFVIGICIRRPAYFMAKQELFKPRWQAWLLNSLGAFPVRRGEADEDAMDTSRMLVERGEMVLVFPEGTRIRKGSLGRP